MYGAAAYGGAYGAAADGAATRYLRFSHFWIRSMRLTGSAGDAVRNI